MDNFTMASAVLIATDVVQAGFQMTQVQVDAVALSKRSERLSGALNATLLVKVHVVPIAEIVVSHGSSQILTDLPLIADAGIGGEEACRCMIHINRALN